MKDLDKDFDEEETDNLSECRTYDLEDDFLPRNHGIYSLSFSEEEKPDEFIDEHQEEEDIQPLKPLMTSYQDYRRQDEETPCPLLSELDDQLIGAKYLAKLDMRWGYDNEHIKNENEWEMTRTNQQLLEPTVMTSCLHYSPTTSLAKTNEIFRDQKNEHQTIVNMDYGIQTKEQDTEYTRCVQQRLRNNDPFTEPEGCTPWVARTEHEGLVNPENQPQMDQTKPQDKRNMDGQDCIDIIMSPERLFPDQLDQELNDERTFEKDDEWFDPIKTLTVHGLKRLPNHFSKVTAATSVNDVIAVSDMNKDPRKRITMVLNMDMTVENVINTLLGKRPDIRKDESENWPIWLLRLPNKKGSSILVLDPQIPKPLDKPKQTDDTITWMIKSPDEITDYGNFWCSRIIEGQNDGRQARQDPSLSKLEGNSECILGWRLKDLTKPMNGTLLPGNLRTSWKRENNLLFYIMAFSLGIHPRPLLMDLSESLNSELVMEDHGSTKGVILGISKPYDNRTDGTTTITFGTWNKLYESSDRKTHFVLHIPEQLLASKLSTNAMHLPWKNETEERINSEIGKSFLATLGHNSKIETSTETREIFLTSSYSTSPITHLHNMFLRKTKSTPILKTPSTFADENERLNRNISHLQNMIDDMIKEYEYMDQPLEFPLKQKPSPMTPTTDNSIFLNQRND